MEIETMKKTVEDAVRQEEGVWAEPEYNAMAFLSGDINYCCVDEFGRCHYSSNLLDPMPTFWVLVCTRTEFEQAAREMGYPKINEGTTMLRELDELNLKLSSAEQTLEQIGFTYIGGGFWNAPDDQPKKWRDMEDGLPPVGEVVEYCFNDKKGEADVLWNEGDQLEVLAHKKVETGDIVLVFWNTRDFTSGQRLPVFGGKNALRPLRTDREKWVEAALQAYLKGASEHKGGIAEIYDAIVSGELPSPKASHDSA